MSRVQPHIILKELLENNMRGDYAIYGFGNEYELKTKMRLNSKVTPLIWFELPYANQTQSKAYLECNIRMFLADSTRKEWQNEQRYATTFTKTLNPLYNKLEKLLDKSLSFLIVDNLINTNEMPNYYTNEIGTRDKPEKFKVEAYWDVLTLDFTAKVQKACENNPIL